MRKKLRKRKKSRFCFNTAFTYARRNEDKVFRKNKLIVFDTIELNPAKKKQENSKTHEKIKFSFSKEEFI